MIGTILQVIHVIIYLKNNNMQLLPFLELPVCLPGEPDKEDKIVPGRFYPTTIVAYHESFYGDRILIYLQNGQPFLIGLSIFDYEEKIKGYFDLITEMEQKSVIQKPNSILKKQRN